jgi:hypothetical protein
LNLLWWGAWQGGSELEPNGSTLMKRRLLEQLGYTVVSLPYWEWEDLEGLVCYLAPTLCRF